MIADCNNCDNSHCQNKFYKRVNKNEECLLRILPKGKDTVMDNIVGDERKFHNMLNALSKVGLLLPPV